MDGRRRRPGCSLLAAFLATRAELLGLMRTLDANKRGVSRPRGGRCSRMLDDRRCRLPGRRRRPGLATNYRYPAADWWRGIPAVKASGRWTGTVAGSPDGGVGQLCPGTLTGTMRPPVRRTRLTMAPHDEVVVAPIKVVIEPPANRKAQAERDERVAERSLVIHQIRLIYGHID